HTRSTRDWSSDVLFRSPHRQIQSTPSHRGRAWEGRALQRQSCPRLEQVLILDSMAHDRPVLDNPSHLLDFEWPLLGRVLLTPLTGLPSIHHSSRPISPCFAS